VDDLLAHLSAAEAHLLLAEELKGHKEDYDEDDKDDLKEEHMKEKTETKEEKKSTTKTAPPATATKKSLKEEVADTDPVARPPAGPTSSSSRRGVYTREEVAAHNTAESCWLIVGNDVYDVTPFLASHPAGPAPLLRRAGGDATRDFHFHSRTAQRSWSQYKIGVLEGSSSSMCLLM
jgi:cytochrome b involved in lipid metabolism